MTRTRRRSARSKPKQEDLGWALDGRVFVEFDGTPYGGTIVALHPESKTVTVKFDDGDEMEINVAELQAEPSYDEDGDVVFDPPEPGQAGAMQCYPITWDPKGYHFHCWAELDGDDLGITTTGDRNAGKRVYFHGSFDRVKVGTPHSGSKGVEGWAATMYARVYRDNESDKYDEFVVEPIAYPSIDYDGEGNEVLVGDPRLRDGGKGMSMVNADICVAIRRWFFFDAKQVGGVETVRQLAARAERPIITCKDLAWLDRLIIKLQEIRTTAIRSGGQRAISIEPTNDGEPTLCIQLDLTTQAIISSSLGSKGKNKGKGGRIPAVGSGLMLDAARDGTSVRSMRTTQKSLDIKADPENVDALTQRLEELTAAADAGKITQAERKAESRKIRAALRRMGHKGGTRAKS